jgi:hypothetical protein
MRCSGSSAVFFALLAIVAGVAHAQSPPTTPIRIGTSLSATPPAFVIRPAIFTPPVLNPAKLRPLPTLFPSPRFRAMAGESAGPYDDGPIEEGAPTWNTAIGIRALASNVPNPPYGTGNTASGYYALNSNLSGFRNTASGALAMQNNTSGSQNTASGFSALGSNTTGFDNTASGYGALSSNTTGSENTATGLLALSYNTEGFKNSATGVLALLSNTTGSSNTASGDFALWRNTTGSYNTAVGSGAGGDLIDGNFNVYLGAWVEGEAHESNTIRIGAPYETLGELPRGHNRTFIAGIVENPWRALPTSAALVGVEPDGRLGALDPASFKGDKGDTGPEGPQGPQGPEGPQGPTGPGLVSGSLLQLVAGATPPAGYVFLGSHEMTLRTPGTKKTTVTVNVYRMQ